MQVISPEPSFALEQIQIFTERQSSQWAREHGIGQEPYWIIQDQMIDMSEPEIGDGFIQFQLCIEEALGMSRSMQA